MITVTKLIFVAMLYMVTFGLIIARDRVVNWMKAKV